MTDRKTNDSWGKRVGAPRSSEECTLLVHLRLISDNWDWIAGHFPGRTVMACQSKYHYHFAPRRARGDGDSNAVKLVRAAITWPEHRLKTETLSRPYRTDLTGVVCGDPAPGRSALEGSNRSPPRRISLAPLACLQRQEAAP